MYALKSPVGGWPYQRGGLKLLPAPAFLDGMLRHPLILLLAALLGTSLPAGTVPPELDRALKLFRAEGARGWAFVQTTESGGENMVEHYVPAKPEFSRWTLLKKENRQPTPAELKEYQDRLSRRTSGSTAPNVKDQIDLASCECIHADETRAAYCFHLLPGASDDRSAAHLTATFTLHKPTSTIERVELAAFEPFSPVFIVKITEAKTIMIYSLPDEHRPSLLQQITVHLRGRALWLKSLDEDMTVTYSEHKYTGRQPVAAGVENPARANASSH